MDKTTQSPEQAANVLLSGGVAIFPTETVYGIGADAYNESACLRIFAIKKRPADNPLILHVDNIESLEKIGLIHERLLSKLEKLLLTEPLTLILPKRERRLFSTGLETIAVRIPSMALTKEMLSIVKVPIAAPSANRSGKPSITRFQDAWQEFHEDVDILLEGPDSTIGLESTVIDLSAEPFTYVRPGAVGFEALKEILPDLVQWEITKGPLKSPGVKYRHYAPQAMVLLIDDLTGIDEKNSGQIGFSLFSKTALDVKVKDNWDYAQKLYAFLIEADRLGLDKVYCERPRRGLLFEALINRLNKAAHK